MPDFMISVSPKMAKELQLFVAAYNDNTGESLTVKQWLHRTVKLILIQKQLAAEINVLKEQKETEAQQALSNAMTAKQQEMLDALD